MKKLINKKIIVILGPTATGKTDLAFHLEKKFNGEAVSADSRQVYIGLDIGTGKYPGTKKKVWMYDVANPWEQYTVYDYVKEAAKIIKNIHKRGKLPILVGGTGLYIKILLGGLPSLSFPPDRQLRRKLQEQSLDHLQKKLQEVWPQRWIRMNTSDRQNPRRLIRAIELSVAKPKKTDVKVSGKGILKIGLTAPRNILYQLADKQVLARVNKGMIEEAKILSFKRMRQLGLEYAVLADYLQGKIDKESLIKFMQYKIHSFARHQLTWFNKEKNVHWFDITDKNFLHNVETLVIKWYDQSDAAQD